MRAVNPPARPWTRILTLLLLFFYVCWLCQDCIQYYSILFVPSMCVQMFHPGPAKFDVSWGVKKRGKSRRSLLNTEESAVGSKRSMPNVILIIADDLGIHDIASPHDVGTPNIDSIADNGVNFLNAYAGHATCAPSRAALYTGRFATRFGFEFTPTPKIFGMILSQASRKNIHQPTFHHENLAVIPGMRDMSVPVNETMIAEVLSQQFKYNTYMLGTRAYLKDTVPTARGFDESLSFLVGASKYLQSSHKDVVNAVIKNSPIDDFLRWNLPFVVSHNNQPKFQPREYMTDFLSKETSKVIHTIHETKNANPFFITVAYNAPHNPLQALQSDYDDPALANVSSHIQRVYFAMIKSLDRGVGTILQALKDTDNWDNTVVIFTSDNGGASYIDIPDVNHPYRGWKGTFFEGGLRVPLYLQWPAMISPGVKVSETVSHVDIFPTVMAAVSMFAKEDTNREDDFATPKPDELHSDSASIPDGTNKIVHPVGVGGIEEATQGLRPAVSLCWCSGFELFSKTLRSLMGRIVEPTLLTVHHLMSSMDGLFYRLMRSLQVTRSTSGGGAADTLSDSGEYMDCEVPKSNSYCKIWSAALGISWIGTEFCDFERVDRKCIAPSISSSSASGRVNKKDRDQRDGSFPLDGIDLLPYVVPQKYFLSMDKLLLFSASKDTSNPLHDRALFWRSGAYKAVLFTQWKIQISSRPDKVWFFNLRTDPLEATNIAEQLNIHTLSDMRKFVSDQNQQKKSPDVSDKALMISKVFQLLEKLDAEQSPPLWPSLIEMPLLIDKTSNSQECTGDEYVYWAN